MHETPDATPAPDRRLDVTDDLAMGEHHRTGNTDIPVEVAPAQVVKLTATELANLVGEEALEARRSTHGDPGSHEY
jgi:hypothetical protein